MFKVNEYFDGTVKSIAFDMTAGPATIGVVAVTVVMSNTAAIIPTV